MPADDEALTAEREHSAPVTAVAGRAAPDGLLRELAVHLANLLPLAQSDTLSVDARFELISRLDDETRSAISRLLGAQASLAFSTISATRRTLTVGRDIFGALLDAYQACIYAYEHQAGDPARRCHLKDCRVRLARAGAERVIWERCCGGPAHEQLWCWLGAAFGEAVSRDKARSAAGFGPPGHCATTVEREYLRAVAAQSAALDLLPPHLIGVVDRLLAFSLPMLQFQVTPFTGATYCIDPCWVAGPRRMVRVPEPVTGLWFFSARVAVDALRELAEQLTEGDVPPGLAVNEKGEVAFRVALEHLLRYWSDTPPVRRYRRHLLGGSLSAVRSIDDLQRLFAGQSVVPQAEWSLRDVSRGGLGAYAPTISNTSVRVGELVGVRPRDARVWQLAVVRRSWTDAGHYPLVGLETLSQNPSLASVDDGRTRAEVLLCDPLLRGEAVRIAAPANILHPGLPLFVTRNGSVQKLKPLESSMAGDGFELRVYQVL